MQTNAAYDLERFAPREQKPRLRVAGQPKPKRGLARYNLKWITAVADVYKRQRQIRMRICRS